MTEPGTAGAARPVTSFEVRAELEERLERDLLGPWDGPEEELPPHDSPAERYLLGRLVPRDAPVDERTADADGTGDDPALVDREVAATTDTSDTDVGAKRRSVPAPWPPRRSGCRSTSRRTWTRCW